MGAGYHGGFGNTQGNKSAKQADTTKVSLPQSQSQLAHIFSGKEGHLADTPENRELLTTLASDSSKFVGKDSYGNSWNVEYTDDGKQNWVRYQNGIINEGGQNSQPRQWDDETGLNNNPYRRKKK